MGRSRMKRRLWRFAVAVVLPLSLVTLRELTSSSPAQLRRSQVEITSRVNNHNHEENDLEELVDYVRSHVSQTLNSYKRVRRKEFEAGLMQIRNETNQQHDVDYTDEQVWVTLLERGEGFQRLVRSMIRAERSRQRSGKRQSRISAGFVGSERFNRPYAGGLVAGDDGPHDFRAGGLSRFYGGRRPRFGGRGRPGDPYADGRGVFHVAKHYKINETGFPSYEPIAPTTDNASTTIDTRLDAWIAAQPKASGCGGKRHMLRVLLEAGLNLTEPLCRALPSWKQVTDLYGEGPVVLGLETCKKYRKLVSQGRAYPQARLAALWNSGSTALARSFMTHFRGYHSNGNVYEPTVTWGKHTPLWLKYENAYPPGRSVEDPDATLPVLILRDPFRWMNSMCKSSYMARWDRGTDGRCPNVIATAQERKELYRKFLPQGGTSNATHMFTLLARNRQSYNRYQTQFENLADLWTTFNSDYLYADFPRLIVRAEDMFFFPEQVLRIIGKCAGMELKSGTANGLTPGQNTRGRAKDLIGIATAMIKYGRAKGRLPSSLTIEERAYLQTALSPELMERMHYPQIPVEEEALKAAIQEQQQQEDPGFEAATEEFLAQLPPPPKASRFPF